MKLLLSAVLLPMLAGAAVWPDAIGSYRRTNVAEASLTDRSVWQEYGLKSSETATYVDGAKRFTATAYVLQDTTGALAAFDWQRDPKAKPSSVAPLASEAADSLLAVQGNFLLSFNGYKPTAAELTAVEAGLRNVDTTALPSLPGFFPSSSLVPNSERYILGPASLQKFEPGIPPSVAAFRMGAEAQVGVFSSPKGDMKLAVFNYPTNQMAMERIGEFQKLPGAVAKRSGPLVAVILSPPDPDAAERVLAEVRYQAAITENQYVPTRRDNIGNLVINAFILIGILAAFCIVAGLFVGGFRTALRLGKTGEAAEPMILLHLNRH